MRRPVLPLLWLSLLVCRPAVGEDHKPPWPPAYTHDDLMEVPEPLFFDLIRRPDSHAGELEVNTLVGVPLHGQARIEWSPEIEYAFAQGHAIELEINVDHDQLHRVQIGMQGVFGWSRNLRFIHGWQLLSAYEVPQKTASGTGLYLFAVRLTPRLSTWMLVGGRVLAPAGEGTQTALVVNPSLYLRVHRRVNLGLEGGVLFGAAEQTYLLLAEAEWDITASLQVHLGIGPRWKDGEPQAFLALRLGWDRD